QHAPQAQRGVGEHGQLGGRAPANMLFPDWAVGHHDRLEAAGAAYYRFPAPEGRERARLVASWSTTEADVDRFLTAF
ncbi:MAG: low specificity L-threonine aldolase, partial [Tabrizicola sp.]